MTADLATASRRAAGAASLTYALLLAGPGVYLPFFPIWLEARGFGPREIGVLLAIPLLMRVVASAPLARIADGPAGPRLTFLVMIAAAALGHAGLILVHGFWPVAVVLALATAFVAPTMALLDVIVLKGVAAHGHDYGRIRYWGSLAFVIANLAAGASLASLPPEAIPLLIAGLAGLTAIAGLTLPPDRSSASTPSAELVDQPVPSATLLAVFSAGLACLHGSHAILMNFATLAWQKAGFTSTEIGVLWAAAVLSETLVFLVAGRFSPRFGPLAFIAAGAIAAVLRWTIMGFEPRAGLFIAALQILHGLTFAAVHFGTIAWLGRFGGRRATRLGIVTSAIGAGAAGGAVVAGFLFERLGEQAYFVMAGVAALGLALIATTASIERRQR